MKKESYRIGPKTVVKTSIVPSGKMVNVTVEHGDNVFVQSFDIPKGGRVEVDLLGFLQDFRMAITADNPRYEKIVLVWFDDGDLYFHSLSMGADGVVGYDIPLPVEVR